MGVLEGFLSTLSQTRATFGVGPPAGGDGLDQSALLLSLHDTVQSIRLESVWRGVGAQAYDTANQRHAGVLWQLAGLERRLAAEITRSAQVVVAGRRSLDVVPVWVCAAAAAVPPGANREQMLMPIVAKGLEEVNAIITASTREFDDIARTIRGIGSEYEALTSQLSGMPESVGGAPGTDKPEDMAELVRKAVADGDPQAAAEVNRLLNGIGNEQLGTDSAAHPLTPVQAELVGQLQAQLKPMSMEDLVAARDRLGPNRGIIANAMQIMSNPNVVYPRHDGDGAQIVSPTGPLPNRGVLPGDRGALPDGVQATLREGGIMVGPLNLPTDHPSPEMDIANQRRELAEYHMNLLTGVVSDGDSRFQQGTELDRGMMASAKQWLASETSSAGPQQQWADGVLGRIFESAGRDTIVDHDMITTDKEFVGDVLTHEWKDDGRSARTLTDWIADAAYSNDSVVNQRAGETASAVADYLGDPANKDALLNITNGSQPNLSIGQMNPELTQGLAHAISPYVDEMAGRPIDASRGWTAKDGEGDLSYPHAAQVMGVLGTDSGAARILDERTTAVQAGYINGFAQSVINSAGHSSDGPLLEAAGRLRGIADQGAFIAASDVESDALKARQAAWDRMSTNYDAAAAAAAVLPKVGPVMDVGSILLKDAMLGPRPDAVDPGHTPIRGSLEMRAALASAFIANGIGDPVDIDGLRPYLSGDGPDHVPAYGVYTKERADFERILNDFFGHLDDSVSHPLDGYDQAYRDVLR